jgi:hypothetical protein
VLWTVLLGSASAVPAQQSPAPGPLDATAPPPEKLSLYVFGAAVEGDDPPGLTGDGPDLALGIGLGQRFNRFFSGEAELLITLGEYDTPPWLSFSDEDMSLTGGFLLYSVKLRALSKRLEPYIGGGLGIAYHELNVTGSFGLSTIGVESDFGFARQLLAGVDVKAGEKTRIGFEVRELDVEADFGSAIGRELDVGGRMWIFAWRQVISRHRR